MHNRNYKSRAILSLTVGIAMVFSSFITSLPLTALAADTGWRSPSNNVNSNNGWDTPSNAYSSNDTRTYANSSSDVVQYYGFDFSALTGLVNPTINGIEVSVEGYTTSTRQADLSLSWDSGNHYTTGTGVKTTNIPNGNSSVEAIKIFGGATDTWNRTWSASDFNNFRLQLDATSGSGGGTPILYVDHVQVKVYYTENNPAPTTTSISPTSKNVGDSGFTLTVNGTNFISSSVVRFDGSSRTTTYVSPTQLTAAIPASDLTSAGTHNITVFNSAPGGGTSGAQTFTVSVPTVPNPTLGQSCGLDIALVLDTSTSIDSSELAQMKSALGGFVTAFLPATPTQFSVTQFNNIGTVKQTFTSNSSLITSAINSVTTGGGTNWEDGLLKAQSTFDPRTNPNLVIFASDGNPNRKGNPAQTVSETEAVNAAVVVADTLKTSGTRIITLGIGNGLDTANLEKISSADAIYTSDFSTLASDLSALATQLCGGTITAHKVIDADGNIQTTNDQIPGINWSFNVAGTSTTTDQSGNTIAVEVEPGSYSVGETQQDGYSLIAADCTGATNNGSLDGSTIYGIQVGSQDIVSCNFYNAPNAGTITVTKQFVIPDDAQIQVEITAFSFSVNNGTIVYFEDDGSNNVSVPVGVYGIAETNPGADWSVGYSDGCNSTMTPGGQAVCIITNTYIPPDLTTVKIIKNVINNNGGTATEQDFGLTLDGGSVTSGQTTVVQPGDHVINEVGLTGYSFISITGVGCPSQLGETITLIDGQDLECTVTNDDIAPTLKLVKNVVGGNGVASNWELSAVGDQNGFTDLGDSNITHPITPGVYYTLSEAPVSGFDSANYTAGTWSCQNGGSFDLEKQSISLTLGEAAICSITNTYNPPEPILGSIHGYKWNDSDNNGQRGEEALLSGWTIFIDENDNGLLDGEEISTQTSDSTEHYGWYWFNDLSMGTYSICEVHQSGWTQTYPQSNCHQVTLPDGNPQSFPITLNAVVGPEYNFGNHYVGQEPKDVCPNLEGLQEEVPGGYNLVDGICAQQSSGGGGGGGGFSCTVSNSPDPALNLASLVSATGGVVTLNLTYTSDITSVILSIDPNFTSQWSLPVAPQVTWQIPAGVTVGNLYVRFANRVGCNSQGQSLSVNASNTQPRVLGVTTTCQETISQYIKYGAKNDPAEVKKLQQFLNEYLGLKLPITGVYGPLTRAALNKFQLKHRQEILKPWLQYGLPSEQTATGYVYKTTKRWINMIKCPDLNVPIPQLP